MKTNSWLKALAFSFALLPATATVGTAWAQVRGTQQNAQGMGKHGHRGGPRKANPEVRTYLRENVMPVVRQQRQKLDAQMSSADKTQLETYRGQLKSLGERQAALRKSFRPEGTPKGQRVPLTDAQKQQLQQLRTERKAVMENVARLAQKYDAQINRLAEEVKPQRDKWAADLQALSQKNLTPEQQQKRAQWQQKRGNGSGNRQNFFGPSRFLLMNPNAPAKAERNAGTGRAALYPNPASSSQRLEYEVKKDGNVKVELLDERGKTLRTLFDGKQDKGTHSLDVNLADLGRGTYLYKITSKGHTETRRFVKE
ncbi:T9SS type A sorting domain-containing protein [Hymenobacter latericus]|uniref:T9SS type A sorting domain-containing protein n=1 Tax=Hymenobacter sp. YIM 151858-1 TaxID=2987688 RepID=UPI0022278011|nr:T9SS type A sorting domain-containing protein [Hymenobacter sp. YIM 151858-1]UYZ61002.1 T9SS type A sorting domain-containing protein [Hymenobacter sp. YIM 151858-1]